MRFHECDGKVGSTLKCSRIHPQIQLFGDLLRTRTKYGKIRSHYHIGSRKTGGAHSWKEFKGCNSALFVASSSVNFSLVENLSRTNEIDLQKSCRICWHDSIVPHQPEVCCIQKKATRKSTKISMKVTSNDRVGAVENLMFGFMSRAHIR